MLLQIKPLRDKVLLKTIEAQTTTKGGIILPDSAKEKPQEAKVIAVGEGKIEDGKLVEPSVKIGDIVIYPKYSGDDVKLDGEEYTLIEEEKILAIVEK
ncbi:MAG: co-chaperone GroES [Candidatus Berkelbacteria bacterium]|nr:co-chaperone GroES [Candidatus Berkelbacteria bacterium]